MNQYMPLHWGQVDQNISVEGGQPQSGVISAKVGSNVQIAQPKSGRIIGKRGSNVKRPSGGGKC